MEAQSLDAAVELDAQDRDAIARWLVAKFAELVECPESDIDVDRPFAEYSLDSSVAVSLGQELSAYLNRELSVTLFWEYPSITTLSTALADGAQSSPVF